MAFVSTSRDHKREDLRVANASTGEVRNILAEKAETFFESGQGRVNWRYLPGSKEVLWFSRKDDYGHLYLHDAGTGFQKNRITTGNGNVTQVLRVDEKARTIYFVGSGKEAGRDPYFRHFYRINLDGSGAKLLTPEDADHTIDLIAVRTVLRRRLFQAGCTAGDRAARRRRQNRRAPRARGHFAARGGGLEAADSVYGEGTGRTKPICTA